MLIVGSEDFYFTLLWFKYRLSTCTFYLIFYFKKDCGQDIG